MQYYTLKCPHCKRVIDYGTGSPRNIGNPLRKCPWCGGTYVDAFTEEWATKSPFKRKCFLISKPFWGAFLAFIPIAGGLASTKMNFLVVLIISLIISVLILIGGAILYRSIIRNDIDESIKRTESAKYVAKLRMAGFKIYPIRGAEIGTIQDENEKPSKDEDIKSVKEDTFTLH